ncbi:hypothetical protein CEXT_637682 [Caerostris extrusa]|uniref:Uncharacterized protein n=1 Tax=Caerostris extrusa TaxID=172846 RepID=A0AAV4MH06_CAEEX|nr:hypothetical protein CEXT_637682 [Caerostris extrusa]
MSPVCQVCVVEPRASVDSLPVQSNRCRWNECYFWNARGEDGGHPLSVAFGNVPKFSSILLHRLTNI